jgi:PhnB protein
MRQAENSLVRISPHLMFDGQCEAAFGLYHRVLGGSLRMLRFGDSPMATEVDPEWHDRIVHATLQIGDLELAGADVLTEDYREPQGFSVILSLDNLGKAERVYSALATGGEARFPFQSTFWSPGFGALIDRFGVPWEVNCAQAPEAVSDEVPAGNRSGS